MAVAPEEYARALLAEKQRREAARKALASAPKRQPQIGLAPRLGPIKSREPAVDRVQQARNAITQGLDYAGNFLMQGRAPEIGGVVRQMVEPLAQFPVTAVTDPLRAANQAQQVLDPAYAMARGLTTTRLGAEAGNPAEMAAGVTEMGLAGLSFIPGGAAVKGARAMPPGRLPEIPQPRSASMQAAAPAMQATSRGPILDQLAGQPELLGGGLGGALGAIQGETPEERARNALLGAAGGAVGGRLARGAAIDRTRMGSNLGNIPKPVQKAQAQDLIPPDIQEKMVKIYDENTPTKKEQISRFMDSRDSEKYSWSKITEEDLIDRIGENEDVNVVFPEAMEIIRREGAAIEYGRDTNLKYAPEKKAPTFQDFFAEAASEEGWIKPNPSTIDDIWQVGVDEYAASQVMEYLAKKEGWTVSPVRGNYRYQTLSKDVPGGTIYLNVRVSDHAKQSTIGHAVYGKDDIDINLAPSFGKGNEQYAADDFNSMLRKMREAEKRGPQDDD